jgi:hypothetical protein
MKLRGHFEAQGKRFYQVIVVGKANAVTPEQADQFISSFQAAVMTQSPALALMRLRKTSAALPSTAWT